MASIKAFETMGDVGYGMKKSQRVKRRNTLTHTLMKSFSSVQVIKVAIKLRVHLDHLILSSEAAIH